METLTLLRQSVAEQVYLSRAKDFSEPFRTISYRNREEMEQVVGNVAGNSFVQLVREQTRLWEERLSKLSARL
jgi:hypothetical protein